jgi:hypothetical protein
MTYALAALDFYAKKDRPKAVSCCSTGERPCLGRIHHFSSSRAASGVTLTILVVESGDLVSRQIISTSASALAANGPT